MVSGRPWAWRESRINPTSEAHLGFLQIAFSWNVQLRHMDDKMSRVGAHAAAQESQPSLTLVIGHQKSVWSTLGRNEGCEPEHPAGYQKKELHKGLRFFLTSLSEDLQLGRKPERSFTAQNPAGKKYSNLWKKQIISITRCYQETILWCVWCAAISLLLHFCGSWLWGLTPQTNLCAWPSRYTAPLVLTLGVDTHLGNKLA